MTHLPKSRLAAGFWLLLAAGLVAYHLALVFAGIVPNLVSRPLHMAFILPFALVFGVTAKGRFYSGIVLAVLGTGAAIWVALNAALYARKGSKTATFSGCAF